MTTSTEIQLTDTYPALTWTSTDEGLCAGCSEKCKRYGSGANPLCRQCFAERAAMWGPGVRQKGFNA
ncbi:hypothetical protein [Streptomyces sp. NPDC018693]|uniref:hypothetical protein n=1 Tax=unclassified Streptomyces TaxID=2593676 RepID=UPI003793CA39